MKLFLTLFLATISTLTVLYPSHAESDLPATLLWEASQLQKQRQLAEVRDETLEKTIQRLRKDAQEAIEHEPYTVISKEDTPPSQNKHDYLSFSRYWWPNPDTENGLPYVRHDGRVNVALRQRGDRDKIGMLFEDVETLALATYFLEEPEYGSHAVEMIRTWFLDESTAMNPNLNYGQIVPGRPEGRGVGIIDTRGFITLLDSVELLKAAGEITEAETDALREWFTQYLSWLRESKLGKEESQRMNNHGSWYAAQTARIALFVGQEDLAEEIVNNVRRERLPKQFLEDGRQPEELARTQSLHYSCFNLEALSVVARLGERLGIDLWQNSLPESSLKPGIDYLLPFLAQEKNWPHQQISRFTLSRGTIRLLRMASLRYKDTAYLKPLSVLSRRQNDHSYEPLLVESL